MSGTSTFILSLLLGLGVACASLNATAQTPAADPLAAPAVADPLADPLAAAPVEAPADSAPAGNPGDTVEVENPYGLEALWRTGDFVSKGTLLILVIMSAATWYILVVKLIEQQKLINETRRADKTFWSSSSVTEGMGKLKNGSPMWYIADRGISATQHHEGTMVEQIDLSSWITMSVNRAVEAINSNLTGGLAVLATVGSTAPFVGLFGTVWGIYHALTAIGLSGQASIDKVAGPVGEALIMTAIGLAVAVPAVLGYNWLVRRNKGAMESVRAFAADLHSVLLSGTRVGEKKTA